jgi:hypothetical protein
MDQLEDTLQREISFANHLIFHMGILQPKPHPG